MVPIFSIPFFNRGFDILEVRWEEHAIAADNSKENEECWVIHCRFDSSD